MTILYILEEVPDAGLANGEEPFELVVLILLKLYFVRFRGKRQFVIDRRVVGRGSTHRVDPEVHFFVGELFESSLTWTHLGDFLIDVSGTGVVDSLNRMDSTASCCRRESALSCLGGITSWPFISLSLAVIISSSITDILYLQLSPVPYLFPSHIYSGSQQIINHDIVAAASYDWNQQRVSSENLNLLYRRHLQGVYSTHT